MNRKNIIRMAQETGVSAERVRDLVNFAALVASAEREACEEIFVANGALGLAAAIRARAIMSKSKTPEPLYRQFTPEEDRGKTRVSKYYRVNQNMDGLGTGLHPYNIECNLRIDFDLDGGIYKVEWSNKVLGERK